MKEIFDISFEFGKYIIESRSLIDHCMLHRRHSLLRVLALNPMCFDIVFDNVP